MAILANGVSRAVSIGLTRFIYIHTHIYRCMYIYTYMYI